MREEDRVLEGVFESQGVGTHAYLFPEKSQQEMQRGKEMAQCFQKLEATEQGRGLSSCLFHGLSSQLFLFCQMEWN
jgi:hypothetical protein